MKNQPVHLQKWEVCSEARGAFYVCSGDTIIASVPYGEDRNDLIRVEALRIANHIAQLPGLLSVSIGLDRWSGYTGTILKEVEKINADALIKLGYKNEKSLV